MLATIALLLVGCGGDDDDDSADAAGTGATESAEPVTLTVGLFGTFGFEEAGLYDEYERLHPNVTIEETSIEFEQDYYQALQTHLAGGAGLSDVQGIEVARIAEVTRTQADKWVDLNEFGAEELADNFFPWKWEAGRPPTEPRSAWEPTPARRRSATAPTSSSRPVFRPTATSSPRSGRTGTTSSRAASSTRPTRPRDPRSSTSASGLYNAIIGQSETQYYDEEGTPIYDTNPVVKDAWDIAVEAIQAGLTAKLEQFDQAWNQAFANGAFATISCPAWMIGYIKGQAGDAGAGKWDVASIPGDGGNWGGSYLSIPAASEHKEEAYALIEWLTAPEQQITMWTDAQHFPSSSTAAADGAVAAATDEYFSNAPIGEIFKESADDLPIATLGPKDGVIKDTISQGLNRVDQQGEDPDEAWQQTMDEIASAIG